MSLDRTAQVQDADGTWLTAFVLTESFENPLIHPAQTFLDANLRVIATADLCSGVEGDCETHAFLNWMNRGLAGPYAVGVKDGPNTAWSGRTVRDYDGADNLRGFVLDPIPEKPRYTSRAIPDADNWALTMYREVELAGAVVELDPPATTAPRQRLEFFPGTDERVFGTDYKFSDFIEQARQFASASGQPIPADSCGTRLQLTMSSPTSGGVLATTPGPTALVQWTTSDGAVRAFDVQVETSTLQGTQWSVSRGDPVSLGVSCGDVARAPGARQSPNAFLDAANKSPAQGNFHRFIFSVGLAGVVSPRPPEQGWDLYEYYLVPPSGSPQDYQYAVDPATGLLEFIRGDPSKLIRK